MRLLLIKLTSMGDLMHAFPALSDASTQIDGLEVDWVVDESFAEVPLWHTSVSRVIKTAHRRWKRSLRQSWQDGEIKHFYQALNRFDYDAIVDLQGNLKSACVAWLRRGAVTGFDQHSCRERPAHWAYQRQFAVSKQQHAITRQRQLLAKALGYVLPETAPDYGALCPKTLPQALPVSKRYIVLVHNASRENKRWPAPYWRALAAHLSAQGYHCLLPCGNAQEYLRAQSIAQGLPQTHALEKMPLNDMAAILSHAQAMVGSDTGLAHLAAVVGTPGLTLYGATDTRLIGTVGAEQQHLVASGGQMADISVDQVWQTLREQLHEH